MSRKKYTVTVYRRRGFVQQQFYNGHGLNFLGPLIKINHDPLLKILEDDQWDSLCSRIGNNNRQKSCMFPGAICTMTLDEVFASFFVHAPSINWQTDSKISAIIHQHTDILLNI
jgi:hypothetical protein